MLLCFIRGSPLIHTWRIDNALSQTSLRIHERYVAKTTERFKALRAGNIFMERLCTPRSAMSPRCITGRSYSRHQSANCQYFPTFSGGGLTVGSPAAQLRQGPGHEA